jgi:hypothetical protein
MNGIEMPPFPACSASPDIEGKFTMRQAIQSLIGFIQEAREFHLEVANQ